MVGAIEREREPGERVTKSGRICRDRGRVRERGRICRDRGRVRER